MAPQGQSPRPAEPGLTRQYSNNQERIDDILERARRRSVAMANTNDSAHASRPRQASSPRSPNYPYTRSPDLPPQISKKVPPLEGILAETESSADEESAIIRRESQGKKNMDYMGTTTAPSLRARHSQTSIRRNTQTPAARIEPGESQARGEDSGHSQSWWKRMTEKYGSIELENKGSVARDHLALERTFLAWLRTSLGFASIGIAITQLFRLNASIGSDTQGQYVHLRQLGKPLGATFLAISVLVLFVGFHRYFESQHWIIRGKFPASRGSIALVALIALILMITSFVVVLVIGPTSYEK